MLLERRRRRRLLTWNFPSFNGGDHGISLQGDQTTNNKTGLSLNDEDEECNNSNHQATMPYCSLINKKNILGCGTAFILFLIAVVTVTMKMNVGVDSNSNSSKQVAFIGGGEEGKGLSSAVAESVTYEFTFVGDGTCVDGNGASYDFITFSGVKVQDAAACGEQCLSCPGKSAGVKLRGFGFLNGREFCSCLLENGLDFNTTLCPGATSSYDDNIGSGPIKALSGQCGQCWSASEVTNEPTASPSKVPTSPPSGAPTPSPSGAPTSSPSINPTKTPSGAPTSSPSKTKNPTVSVTAQPTAVPTNSKAGKVPKAGTTVQTQAIKSRGSTASISCLVGILVSIVALGAFVS